MQRASTWCKNIGPSIGGKILRFSTEIAVYLANGTLINIDSWLLGNVNRKSSMAYRSVSFPMTLSDLERQDARNQSFFQVDLLNKAGTVWSRTTKLGRITRVGEGRISRGLVRPLPQRGGTPTLLIFGFLLFIHRPFDAELPNLML